MQKVKTFFHVFIYSMLPQEPYYSRLLRTPFKFSLKYFITLVIFLQLLFTILIALTPKWYYENVSLPNSVLASLKTFPEDLTITIKNGRVLTNYQHPYFLWIRTANQFHPFLVVDTTGSPANIKNYGSDVLITGSHIAFRNDDGKTYVMPLGKLSMTVNSRSVQSFTETYTFLIKLLVILYAAFIAPLFMLIKCILYILIASLISLLVWKFSSKRVTFKKIFQIGMHTITFPLLLFYALRLFYPGVEIPSKVFFITVLIFINGGMYEAYLNDHPKRLHR